MWVGQVPLSQNSVFNIAHRIISGHSNSGDDTNGSQMFFVDKDTTLAPKYNVLGTISEEGLETLDKVIEEKKDTEGADGNGGTPDPEVRITSATVDA